MSVHPQVILRHPWTYNMSSTTPDTRREEGSKLPGDRPASLNVKEKKKKKKAKHLLLKV